LDAVDIMTYPELSRQDLMEVVIGLGGRARRLAGARLFITGGTGFFGTWLLESLLNADRELQLRLKITALTRDARRFAARSPHLAAAKNLELVEADMCHLEAIGGSFDFGIHAATETFGDRHGQVDPVRMLQANISGTTQFLNFASRCGLSRMLYISSGAVYGPQQGDGLRIPETCASALDPLDPAAVNGEAKRCSEMLCALHGRQQGFPSSVIARCFSFLGPLLPLDYSYAAGNLLRDGLQGGPLTIQGDGTPLRSYLYPSDLVVWLLSLLLDGKSGEAYNVGSEEGLSIASLAEAIRDRLSPKSEIIIRRQASATARVSVYVPSTQKARESLGLQQTVSLREAIERSAAWWRTALNR